MVDHSLWKKNLVRVPIEADGNCLFKAASFGLQLNKVYQSACYDFVLDMFDQNIYESFFWKLMNNLPHNRNKQRTMVPVGRP